MFGKLCRFQIVPLCFLLLVPCLVYAESGDTYDPYCFPYSEAWSPEWIEKNKDAIVETPVFSKGDNRLIIKVVEKASQKPISSYRVTIGEITGEREVTQFPSKTIESMEGKAFFPELPNGKLLVLVHAEEYATWHSWITLPLESFELDVELEPAIKITGRFLDRATNKPIEGYPVQIKGKSRFLHEEYKKGYFTKSNADGYFEFCGFPKEIYSLSKEWFPETVVAYKRLKGSEQWDQKHGRPDDKRPYLLFDKKPEFYALDGIFTTTTLSMDQDFGDIKLDAVGFVYLSLVTENHKPLANYPIALGWVNPADPERYEIRGKRSRLTIQSWHGGGSGGKGFWSLLKFSM